jgi:hypothetical protein
MTTTGHIQSPGAGLRALLVLLLATLAAAAATTDAPAAAAAQTVQLGPVRLLATTLSTRPRSFSYGWPLKPFDRQHPIRAFLNDPRIGHNGGTSFHFGVDVSAPDGTPVYAVEGGKVFFDSPRAIAVLAPDGTHSFGYWHIVPAVKSHQIVRRHQLLGYIERGWQHVHFAERRGDVYVNPLRDGGLGPYSDHTAPHVVSVELVGGGLVATAYDTPDPVVPGEWTGLPVTPALLRWRTVGAGAAGAWHTAVDSRTAMLPRSAFGTVYTPATRQNHKGEPGRFSFYLARNWRATGVRRIDLQAADVSGNSSVATVALGLPAV